MPKKKEWIESYLKEKNLPTYKEYVKAYAKDAEEAYRESLMRADTAYAEAKATHGTKNASLLARGLSASGYSDYFNGAAYAARSRAVSDAEKELRLAENQNRASYAAFLEKEREEADAAYEKEMDKEGETLSSAFSKLLSAGIADEESAAQFLMGLGVDEDSARSLAQRNTEIVKGTAARRNSVLNHALTQAMSYTRAYNYAIANGLSAALAHEIATISEEARGTYFEDEENNDNE